MARIQRRRSRVAACVLVAALVAALLPGPGTADASLQFASPIDRVSLSESGQQGLDWSALAGIGYDGDVVGLNSASSNMAEGDRNIDLDGFLRTGSAASTLRVTMPGDGSRVEPQSNHQRRLQDVSSTGRFVLFNSTLPYLVPGDSNGVSDLFLKDLETNKIERINVSTSGEEANYGNLNDQAHVSEDGNLVVFFSWASNLVAADRADRGDVYLRDRRAATTVLLRDPGLPDHWWSHNPDITPDGRFVVVSMGYGGVYRYEVATGNVELVSTARGSTSQPAISADGRFVVYLTHHITRKLVMLRDMESSEPAHVITAKPDGRLSKGSANVPSISDDGRLVAFMSSATDLGPEVAESHGDYWAYVYDREFDVMRLVSRNVLGEPGDVVFRDNAVLISGDGSTLAFTSDDSHLVAGDTNGVADVFVVNLNHLSGCHVVTISGAGEITGTSGDDVIEGSDGDDVIDGRGGDDIICGLGGDDVIDGGAGNDVIFGDTGADVVHGGTGADRIFGGQQNDRLHGGGGEDMVYGGPGEDLVVGEGGNDMLGGGPDADRVIGGPGNDSLGGGGG